MKSIIVDDEPLARRELRHLLAEYPWIEIVGEAGNVAEAATLIETLAADLIFLDIQMPGGSGFDLLERLDHVPRVVFTTAYDHHAVRAFEVSAIDYLLKPIEPLRLAAALTKVRATLEDRGGDVPPDKILERLFVRDVVRCWFVPLHEVRMLMAEGNYVRLYWGEERPLLGRPLHTLEQRLDPKRFFRANRRQIINVDFIEGVELGVGGQLHVQLRGGAEVEISRRQARLFRMRMSV